MGHGEREPQAQTGSNGGAPGASFQQKLLVAAIMAIVVVLIGLAATAIRGANNAATDELNSLSGLGAEVPPPWPSPADVPARVAAAGLTLGQMGTAEHFHVHLTVYVDGKHVPLPANIGVDPSNGTMSDLHTHGLDGLVHIESATEGQVFSLGQLFTEWNVRLTESQIGSLTTQGGRTLRAFVNGDIIDGNPALIRLADRQHIVLVYGPANAPVEFPAPYDFDSA